MLAHYLHTVQINYLTDYLLYFNKTEHAVVKLKINLCIKYIYIYII